MDAPDLHDAIRLELGSGTDCHKRGDPIHIIPGAVWDNDIWMIEASVPEEADLGRHLRWMIDFIQPHLSIVHKWRDDGVRMDIYLSWAFTQEHSDFLLSSKALKALAELRIPFVVSLDI